MATLIDRDELYKALASWDWQDLYLPVHFKELVDDLPVVRHSYEDGIRKGYEDAVLNYAKMALMQWIPVSERLPLYGQDVLAVRTYGDGEKCQEVLMAHIAVWNEETGAKWWNATNITYWMPLPEPPR